jgi:acetyltransferase-like isoleucine patch superfamily enzyme/acyl carrier protein
VIGAPVVQNLGQMVVGDALTLVSTPVASHLITGVHGSLHVGSRVTIAHGAAIAAHAHVEIGDDVRIGPYVMIMDTDFHDVKDRERAGEARPIVVARGARIGARVTILPGAIIGEHARVAAGSVVSGTVAAGAVVSGVPAREVTATAAARGMDGMALERIPELVQRTLGLPSLPDLSSGPDDLAGWDSLGMLNILLTLEDAFGVRLEQSDLLGVRCVRDLAAVVRNAVPGNGVGGAMAHATTEPASS